LERSGCVKEPDLAIDQQWEQSVNETKPLGFLFRDYDDLQGRG
jgi:hypothetical protein